MNDDLRLLQGHDVSGGPKAEQSPSNRTESRDWKGKARTTITVVEVWTELERNWGGIQWKRRVSWLNYGEWVVVAGILEAGSWGKARQLIGWRRAIEMVALAQPQLKRGVTADSESLRSHLFSSL